MGALALRVSVVKLRGRSSLKSNGQPNTANPCSRVSNLERSVQDLAQGQDQIQIAVCPIPICVGDRS